MGKGKREEEGERKDSNSDTIPPKRGIIDEGQKQGCQSGTEGPKSSIQKESVAFVCFAEKAQPWVLLLAKSRVIAYLGLSDPQCEKPIRMCYILHRTMDPHFPMS